MISRRRSLFVQTTLIALLAVGSSARAQGPLLRDIPTNIGEPTRSQLINQRAGLVEQRGALAAQVRAHNERCGDVPESSASETACAPSQRRLNAAIAAYRAAVEAFNSAVASAPRANP
jgi:hypothetical protein